MQPTKEWPYRYSKERLDEAKAVFERYAQKELSYDEVEESITNLVNFYLVLLEAHKESQAKAQSPQG
jgi:hypothetical protein